MSVAGLAPLARIAPVESIVNVAPEAAIAPVGVSVFQASNWLAIDDSQAV